MTMLTGHAADQRKLRSDAAHSASCLRIAEARATHGDADVDVDGWKAIVARNGAELAKHIRRYGDLSGA